MSCGKIRGVHQLRYEHLPDEIFVEVFLCTLFQELYGFLDDGQRPITFWEIRCPLISVAKIWRSWMLQGAAVHHYPSQNLHGSYPHNLQEVGVERNISE